jgi:hypothetical protein
MASISASARRDGRNWPHRPGPGPGPGPRRSPYPSFDLVRNRHRQPGACHRPRMRPTRTASQRTKTTKRRRPGPPAGHDPPGRTGDTGPPGFSFTVAGQSGPPGGYGTWRLATGTPGQADLIVALESIPTGECDHGHQARGHDPGATLRHLTQVRHATCTGPACRRPAARSDFEHNIPYEAGGRTCLCNSDPQCRHDHRMKQDPRWEAEHLPSGHVRWTTPSGRQYTTEPTRYPI